MADLRVSLHQLELKGVEELENSLVGTGAYGEVHKVKYKGMICAAKKLHSILVEAESEQSAAVCERFEQECLQLSKLRHPNITAFLGVYFQRPSSTIPLLIMEFVEISLDECLKQYPDLPDYIKNKILLDVATGLAYLHGLDPQVIHRDLTAKNVLVSENFRGKIADLGVAKIINFDITKLSDIKMTSVPGTVVYMPPEAFMKNPKYTEKLDIFSFGNLILNTVNEDWPTPCGAMLNESGSERLSEIERREVHLLKMGDKHHLRKLTLDCLQNDPDKRPTALDAAGEIELLINTNPPPLKNLFEMMQEVVSTSKSVIKLQEKIANIKRDGEELRHSYTEMSECIRSKDDQIAALKQELEATKELADISSLVPQATNVDLETGVEEVKKKISSAKDQQIQALTLEIERQERSRSKKVSLLDPLTELHWEKLPDLPEGRKHPQVVELDGKVYVGSGYAASEEPSYLVYAYDLETSEWETLPKCDTQFFAMTVFEENLILIGGKTQDGKFSSKVYSLNNGKWIVDCIPQMLDPPRCGSSATSAMLHIVLAGGYDSTRNRINLVDVYESYNKTWFRSKHPLPRKAAEMKSALLKGDTWYLLGGANQLKEVYCTSLQSTIFQTTNSIMISMESTMNSKACPINDSNSQASSSDEEESDGEMDSMKSSHLWSKLPNIPNEFSSVTIFGNALLSLGGERGKLIGTGYLNAIYMYMPHMASNPWVHFANLPIAVCRAGVVALKSGEMMIVGGRMKGSNMSSQVYKCSLRQSKLI